MKFLVKKIKHKKILENGKKYWKSQGNLSARKSGNPDRGLRNVRIALRSQLTSES